MQKRAEAVFCQLCAVFALLLMSVWLSGCGSTSSNSPNTSSSSSISTTLTTKPPSSMAVNQTAQIAATVANDSANKGVDWSCTPVGSCGTLNPAHTASGANTTYTAPGAGGSVTIKAASTADPTATATATVTIGTSVAVTLTTAPPANVAAGQTATIAATVANDSANGGVDWSCTPSGTCGTFNPAHTASGANTTYTAPASAGSVTLKAASTTNNTITATATVTITTSSGTGPALSSGTFTFYVSGEDTKSNTYAIAGSFVLDSNGNVTGGEQDYNSVGGATSTEPGGDKITGGKLTTATGTTGGTLTLVTNDTNVGVKGTETFLLSAVNAKHAFISEFDTGGTSSGSVDLQSLTPGGLAQINGPFVMVVSGRNGSKQEVFGGLVNGQGNGSLHVTIDQNGGGAISLNGSNTGTYTAPDTSGRGTLSFGGDQFAYYVVNAKVLRVIVVTPGTDDVGSAFAGVSGVSNATLKTKMFFTDASTLSSGASFVAAGQITTDGNGNVTGFADVNENGHATSSAITGTYTVNASGYGNITIKPGNTQDVSVLGLYLADPTINFSDPNSPADAGVRGLLIDLDTKIVGSGALLVPPSGSVSLAGNFAFDIQSNSTNESDAVGAISIKTNALTGTEGLNDLFGTGQGSNLAIAGTLTPDAANAGRYTIPITTTIAATQVQKAYVLYRVSNSQVVLIESDTHLGEGILEAQH